jgi:hypothetical protein
VPSPLLRRWHAACARSKPWYMPSLLTTRRAWLLVRLALILGLFGAAPVGLAQTATTTPGATPTSTTVPTDGPTAVATGSPTVVASVTDAPTATPQPAPTAPTATVDANALANAGGGGGPRNLVKVQNLQDNTLRVDGKVQLGRIPGPMVAPENLAQSYSSCVNCQTLSVALQVDLITADSVRATPRNAAVAVNYQCSHCRTIAIALQYVLTVDDPTQVPPATNQLIAEMRRELVQMRGDQNLTLPEAEARALSVIGEFQDLAANLNQQRDESTDPTTRDAPPP